MILFWEVGFSVRLFYRFIGRIIGMLGKFSYLIVGGSYYRFCVDSEYKIFDLGR